MRTRSLDRRALRRLALMAAVVAGVLLIVAPASADHGRYRRGPKVAVFVGLPPIALHVGPRPVYYEPLPPHPSYAYEEGYEDGYYDRAREEWRRRHWRRHHHHHDDCDD